MAKNRKVLTIYSSSGDSDVAATNEIDMGPYVHTGVMELEAFWVPFSISTDATTDKVFDAKLQEAATTVDSDFSDISGAAFTQATLATVGALQQLSVTVTKRYLRGYLTMGGTSVDGINVLGVVVTPRFDT